MKKYLGVFLAICCLSFTANAYNLTAQLSSEEVSLGQEVTLTITTDERVNEDPDFSVLQPDFEIFSQSQSVFEKMEFSNKQRLFLTEWKVVLVPLKEGTLDIPAIKVGRAETSPLTVTVNKASVATADLPMSGQIPQYMITGEVKDTERSIYVQQQILYNIIVTDDGSLQRGAPEFLNNNDWNIKILGDPEITVRHKDGRQIRQITYKFALFAQKSGQLKIPAVEFSGAAYNFNNLQDFDLSDNIVFNIGFPMIHNIMVPVNLYIPEKEIEILPVPESFKGQWWLPAESVKLQASWAEENPIFKVGEAVTRKFTIEGVGITDSQLPELKFENSSQFKQYPQRGNRTERIIGNNIVSFQQTDNMYIPQQSGLAVLPPVKITWFNTKTQKLEQAIIPEEHINVKAAVENESQISTEDMLSSDSQSLDRAPSVSNIENRNNKDMYPVWFWISAAFIMGILCSWLLFYRVQSKSHNKPQCETRQFPDFIIQKAYQNDYRALRDALITWAVGFYPDKQINNLKDIAGAAKDTAFAEQLDILLAKLYQDDSEQVWNAKIFADSFKKISKEKKSKKEKPPLPLLYK